MAININDDLKRKAIKLLEDDQNQLKDAFSKQSPRGSFGMESEFIPEISELTQRKERRITKDSKGRYSEEEVTVNQKYYDETVVDDQEKKIKEDAETLQEVCRAYDNEMIRLNGLIDEVKVKIVNLSNEASEINCWPGIAISTMTGESVSYQQITQINNEVEKIKIYPKMAGPQFSPGAENPFDPDIVTNLTSEYAGFGYQNLRDNNNSFILNGNTLEQTTSSGIITASTDGSGSSIGSGQFNISNVESTHNVGSSGKTLDSGHQYNGAGVSPGSYDGPGTAQSRCVAIQQEIENEYLKIPPLRAERDSYRNKLNALKKGKSEKELSHWGVQNTKNEVNVRENKNKEAIDAINELDGADPIQQEGLVLYFDAGNNSSYFGSGTTWYDISNDDYDDNGTISSGTFIEDFVDPEENYFEFTGGAGVSNSGNRYVEFDIDNDAFVDPDTITVEILSKINVNSNNFNVNNYGGMMFGWSEYAMWLKTPETSDRIPGLGFNIGGGTLVGIKPQTVEELLINNDTWIHYTFVMHKYDSNNGTVKDQLLNNKIYINGVSQSIEELRPSATYASGKMIFNNGAGRICARSLDNHYNLPMDVSLFRVYTKELTQEEISDNYNSVKDRFGIV